MNSDIGSREAVRDLIQRTGMLLDAEDFSNWLALFEADGVYLMRAYSTELRRWMIWQQSDRPTLERMLADVVDHVRDPSQRRHVIGYPAVEVDGNNARAASPFSLYRTSTEGQSSLYMVGRYKDRFVRSGDQWRYTEHIAIIDTRMLDMFTHIPV